MRVVLERREVLFYTALYRCRIDIANDHYSHAVWCIPLFVVSDQLIPGKGLKNLNLAYRIAGCKAGILEKVVQQELLKPVLGSLVLSPLLYHNPTLIIYILLLKLDIGGPLAQHLYALVHQLGLVRGNLKHEHGLVIGCICVDLRAELDSILLQEIYHLVPRIFLGSIESHVLEEMGQPQLVIILHHRA